MGTKIKFFPVLCEFFFTFLFSVSFTQLTNVKHLQNRLLGILLPEKSVIN